MVIKALILFRGFCIKRPAPGTPSRVPSGTDPLRKKARDLRLCRIAPHLLPLTVSPVDSPSVCGICSGLSQSGVCRRSDDSSVARSVRLGSGLCGSGGRWSVSRSVRLGSGLSGSGGAVCPSQSQWVRRVVVWPVWSVRLGLCGSGGRWSGRSGLSVSASVGPAGRSVARSVRLGSGLSGSGGQSVCPSWSQWVRRVVVWPVWSVRLGLSGSGAVVWPVWSVRLGLSGSGGGGGVCRSVCPSQSQWVRRAVVGAVCPSRVGSQWVRRVVVGPVVPAGVAV